MPASAISTGPCSPALGRMGSPFRKGVRRIGAPSSGNSPRYSALIVILHTTRTPNAARAPSISTRKNHGIAQSSDPFPHKVARGGSGRAGGAGHELTKERQYGVSYMSLLCVPNLHAVQPDCRTCLLSSSSLPRPVPVPEPSRPKTLMSAKTETLPNLPVKQAVFLFFSWIWPRKRKERSEVSRPTATADNDTLYGELLVDDVLQAEYWETANISLEGTCSWWTATLHDGKEKRSCSRRLCRKRVKRRLTNDTLPSPSVTYM